MRLVLRLGLVPFAFALAMAGCGGDGPTEPPDPPLPNFVRLESDPEDYIGGGLDYEYTQANAIITVTATGRHLSLRIQGDEWWFAELEAPGTATRLQPGTYSNLHRGNLDWSGEGRGCNTIAGSFVIDRVTYDATEALTALDLRFEQHCEGGAAALHGTIHWRSDDTTSPPKQVTPVPSGLWDSPTPTDGRFVYLQSDAGDYIGSGFTYSYTGANSTIDVTSSGRHITVSVDGWGGNFEAMNSVSRIEPGYYPDLIRWPFHNPTKGGLDWSGQGRGCNTLRGWFAVDEVTYTGSEITALRMRFEQHCEGGTPALRGVIRWSE
jgi:hypothetical protein